MSDTPMTDEVKRWLATIGAMIEVQPLVGDDKHVVIVNAEQWKTIGPLVKLNEDTVEVIESKHVPHGQVFLTRRSVLDAPIIAPNPLLPELEMHCLRHGDVLLPCVICEMLTSLLHKPARFIDITGI